MISRKIHEFIRVDYSIEFLQINLLSFQQAAGVDEKKIPNKELLAGDGPIIQAEQKYFRWVDEIIL